MSCFRIYFARLVALIIFRGPVVVGLGRSRFIFDPRSGAIVPQAAGGAPDDDADGDNADDDSDKTADDADDGDKTDDDASDKDGDKEPDWKSESRKHERRAKAEKKRADDLAAAQAARDAENETEQQKALKAAREEATTEVTTRYETERRAERLELAVTRSATKGVKVTLDGEEKLVKFADPDDAMAHLERAIKRGDIDGDDIYDEDGKVDKEALTSALVELLEDKPHLRASANGNGTAERKGGGDADLGKGKGGGKGVEDMSTAEHIARMAQGQK